MDLNYLLLVLPSLIFFSVFSLVLISWRPGGKYSPEKEKTAIEKKNELRVSKVGSYPTPKTILALNKWKAMLPNRININNFIILQCLAFKENPYRGQELIQVFRNNGLVYGAASQLFHYYIDPKEKKKYLFSIASLSKLGTFDLTQIEKIVYPGLCLFMAIDKNNSLPNTLPIMLKTAQTLIHSLGGLLCDKELKPLAFQDFLLDI